LLFRLARSILCAAAGGALTLAVAPAAPAADVIPGARAAAIAPGSRAAEAPRSATPAADFAPCGDPAAGAECATVQVPLDRGGHVPGTVDLAVERFAKPGATKVAIALGGGPGLAITPFADLFRSAFDAILPADTQLVVFDWRGTGRSGALDCPELQDDALILEDPADVRSCAERLGPRRAFYTTRDNVEDLEAVRRALGAETIALYGPSYGSEVAAAYALRYPERVERMALDGINPPEGRDVLYRPSMRAAGRILGSVCAEGRCARVSPDPVGDLRAVVRRIGDARGALTGTVIDRMGARQPQPIRRFGILQEFLLDRATSFPAELPAAIASAARSDLFPVARLRALDSRPPSSPPPSSVQSNAVFAATSCEGGRFPWQRTASREDKLAQARRAIDAIPASEFDPFDRDTAFESNFIQGCSAWIFSPETPSLGLRSPTTAPVLGLDGEDDEQTPLEQARGVVDRFPHGTLFALPATGHVGLISDTTGCALSALRAFFSGGETTNACAGKQRTVAPEPRDPTSLAEIPEAAGVTGQRGRVVSAVRLTLDDVLKVGRGLRAPAWGGLRGGWFRLTDTELRLVDVEYVPGVRVLGTLAFQDGAPVGRLAVSGASSGGLDLAADGSISGALDDQPVSSPPPPAG
jgi:pimeloyl-ACP methyl ester carboxylesterase